MFLPLNSFLLVQSSGWQSPREIPTCQSHAQETAVWECPLPKDMAWEDGGSTRWGTSGCLQPATPVPGQVPIFVSICPERLQFSPPGTDLCLFGHHILRESSCMGSAPASGENTPPRSKHQRSGATVKTSQVSGSRRSMAASWGRLLTPEPGRHALKAPNPYSTRFRRFVLVVMHFPEPRPDALLGGGGQRGGSLSQWKHFFLRVPFLKQ